MVPGFTHPFVLMYIFSCKSGNNCRTPLSNPNNLSTFDFKVLFLSLDIDFDFIFLGFLNFIFFLDIDFDFNFIILNKPVNRYDEKAITTTYVALEVQSTTSEGKVNFWLTILDLWIDTTTHMYHLNYMLMSKLELWCFYSIQEVLGGYVVSSIFFFVFNKKIRVIILIINSLLYKPNFNLFFLLILQDSTWKSCINRANESHPPRKTCFMGKCLYFVHDECKNFQFFWCICYNIWKTNLYIIQLIRHFLKMECQKVLKWSAPSFSFPPSLSLSINHLSPYVTILVCLAIFCDEM